MTEIIEIQTERLLLRQWRKEDLPEFAGITSDPVVMEFYPSILSSIESNTMAERLESLISERGWGFWAVEIKDGKSFIGFVGLHKPTYELPFTPCVEVGWLLAKECWGKGYATEAGKASMNVGFNELGLSEIYSFTSISNKRSRAVMKRLSMVNLNKNFEHPKIPPGSSLRKHVLYKVDRKRWNENVI